MNRSQGGFAVLIILWMLALLALIADRMIVVGRSEVRIADNLRMAAVAEAAADGAIFEGIYRLGVKGPGGWKIDGRDCHVSVGRENVLVRLEDESMKINLNAASAPLLQALLQQVGMPSGEAREVAARIVLRRTQVARPEVPLAGNFRTLGQLATVAGMSRGVMARLIPHLTLNDPGARAPGPLDRVVAAALREAPPAPVAKPANPANPNQKNTITTRTFMIRALIGSPDAPLFERDAIISLNGNQSYRILSWQANGDV